MFSIFHESLFSFLSEQFFSEQKKSSPSWLLSLSPSQQLLQRPQKQQRQQAMWVWRIDWDRLCMLCRAISFKLLFRQMRCRPLSTHPYWEDSGRLLREMRSYGDGEVGQIGMQLDIPLWYYHGAWKLRQLLSIGALDADQRRYFESIGIWKGVEIMRAILYDFLTRTVVRRNGLEFVTVQKVIHWTNFLRMLPSSYGAWFCKVSSRRQKLGEIISILDDYRIWHGED